MDIYLNSVLDIDNSSLLSVSNQNLGNVDELFIKKINESILVFEVYNYLKLMVMDHPQYSPDGTDENTSSIFAENNISTLTGNNIKFRSLSESSIQKYINNKLLYSNLKSYLNNNGLKAKNPTFYFSLFGIIESSEKNLSVYLESGDNDVFVKTFIPYYSTRSQFFTLLTENDENLFLFINNVTEYYLSIPYNQWKMTEIHRDVIISIIKTVWIITDISLLNTTTINNLLLIFPSSILDINQFMLKIKKRYVMTTFIIHLLESNKSIFYDFVKSNNLFKNALEDSVIFSSIFS